MVLRPVHTHCKLGAGCYLHITTHERDARASVHLPEGVVASPRANAHAESGMVQQLRLLTHVPEPARCPADIVECYTRGVSGVVAGLGFLLARSARRFRARSPHDG